MIPESEDWGIPEKEMRFYYRFVAGMYTLIVLGFSAWIAYSMWPR